jgi:hypothetical protein
MALQFDTPVFEFYLECPKCKNRIVQVGRDLIAFRSLYADCPNCGTAIWHTLVGKKFLKNEPLAPDEEDPNIAKVYCIKNLRTGGWFCDYYNPSGTYLKDAQFIHSEKSAKARISRMIKRDRFIKENYTRADFKIYEISVLPEKEL